MIYDLAEETAKLLPKNTPEDLAVVTTDPIIYLTGVFKNGFVIGFWTQSPWGHTTDQDRGWAILDTNLQIIDSCQSYDFGPTHQIREWRHSVKEEYGTAKKLCDEYSGEQFWKLSEEQ